MKILGYKHYDLLWRLKEDLLVYKDEELELLHEEGLFTLITDMTEIGRIVVLDSFSAAQVSSLKALVLLTNEGLLELEAFHSQYVYNMMSRVASDDIGSEAWLESVKMIVAGIK